MNADQVLKEKQYGDIKNAAPLVGINPNNIVQVLRRPTSKRHSEVLRALEMIIANRQRMYKNCK